MKRIESFTFICQANPANVYYTQQYILSDLHLYVASSAFSRVYQANLMSFHAHSTLHMPNPSWVVLTPTCMVRLAYVCG